MPLVYIYHYTIMHFQFNPFLNGIIMGYHCSFFPPYQLALDACFNLVNSATKQNPPKKHRRLIAAGGGAGFQHGLCFLV